MAQNEHLLSPHPENLLPSPYFTISSFYNVYVFIGLDAEIAEKLQVCGLKFEV
jgi:hypothetical protein